MSVSRRRTVEGPAATAKTRMTRPVDGGPRALRVGVMQGGRILEERIFREREKVSVGQSARCDFVVADPRLPAHHVLFDAGVDGYGLRMPGGGHGRVSVSGVPLDVAEGESVDLDERSRGRVVMGETTFLFQLVVPPPLQPRPQLPPSMKGEWVRAAVDSFRPGEGMIGAIWLAMGVIAVSAMVFFNVHDWPVEAHGFEIDNRILRLVLDDPVQPVEVETGSRDGEASEGDEGEERVAEADDPASGDAEKAKREPKRGPLTPEQIAEREAKKKAMLEAALASGLAVPLGTRGDGTGNAGQDLLEVGAVSSDIDAALAKMGKLGNPASGDGLQALHLPGHSTTSEAVEVGEIRAAQADAEVDSSQATEGEIKGSIKITKPEEQPAPGILDPAEVKKKIRGAIPAIRNCYNKALQLDHGLQGKLSVEFTIGTTGRITKAKATEDSLGNPQVTACVLKKIETLTFDRPDGGHVVFVYPFVFKPGA